MQHDAFPLKHGTKGGPFEGRVFVQPRSHQRQLHLALALIRAEMRGTGFLLPEGQEERCIAALRPALNADNMSAAGELSAAEYRAGCLILEMKLSAMRCGGGLADKARAAARKQLESMSPAERAAFAAQLSRNQAPAYHTA